VAGLGVVLVTEGRGVYVATAGESEYSPEELDRHLRCDRYGSRWLELLALAEQGPSVQGMQRDEGSRGDPAYSNAFWAINTVADIERAWAHLSGPPWSLRRAVIKHRMEGWPLGVIAREMRASWTDVKVADYSARREMAEYLGWRATSTN
jgi:DNA-directed RNA polymerase specialized sigma24 family protein